MRQDIDTAPRDGRAIVLEDGPNGTYQIAEWSKDAGAWIDEHGDPVKGTPAYWHALPVENHLESEDPSLDHRRGKRRRMAALIIGATLVAAIGIHAKSYLETHVSPQVVTRHAGLYLSRIDQWGRASVERASGIAAHGIDSVRAFAGSQEWLVQFGRIGDHLGRVWQNEIPRQVAPDRPASLMADDGVKVLASNEPSSVGPQLRLAEAGGPRMEQQATARALNGDEDAANQPDLEKARSLAIEAELETARRQIALNARLLDDVRHQARLEQVAIEESGRQHADSLLRTIEVLRHAQEVNTGALNSARNEAQEHKVRAERAVADARRERDRARLLAKQLHEARLEIDARTVALNEWRKSAEKHDVERASAERQQERNRAETPLGN